MHDISRGYYSDIWVSYMLQINTLIPYIRYMRVNSILFSASRDKDGIVLQGEPTAPTSICVNPRGEVDGSI